MPSLRPSPFAECLLALKGRDLAPEEFVSVLIELGCLAYQLRRRGRPRPTASIPQPDRLKECPWNLQSTSI